MVKLTMEMSGPQMEDKNLGCRSSPAGICIYFTFWDLDPGVKIAFNFEQSQ
jgi:hypothetical protein